MCWWLFLALLPNCAYQAEVLLHETLSEKQLHNIFGTKWKADVPEYWVDYPKLNTATDLSAYSINVNGENYEFLLKENHQLLPSDFLSITSHDNSSRLDVSPSNKHCIFHGESTSHNGTVISLVGCGKSTRGMLATPSGMYLIHPVHYFGGNREVESSDKSHAHVIHKRSPNRPTVVLQDRPSEAPMMEKPCLFSKKDDPFPDEREDPYHFLRAGWEYERLTVIKGPLTLELAVFADDAMWSHFQELYGANAETELQHFILAAVNNIHLLLSHNSIDPKINLRIVRYEVMKTPPAIMARSNHRNGEVDLLLEGFCQHQNDINPSSDADPRHWDHALLFSGFDLYRGRLKSVAGYAPVKGMCSGIRSCTINEGLDFGAVFVITHEMGHSLGMYHDGDNGCDSRCCIMSPSVGTGKTQWSDCSVKEFTSFVSKLGTGFLPKNCLQDGHSDRQVLDHSQSGILPGQRYTVDQQCRIFHGDCWKQELRDGQELSSICEMVWCGAGEGVIRTTHPALEGTYCGQNKWCIEGRCQNFRGVSPRRINGAWTEWNDKPTGTCGGDCSSCDIDGQLRLRRSIRLCENPAPNNGGLECKGSQIRGLICDIQKCDGLSPDQYASKVCSNMRNDKDTPDLLLSGRGFQYSESPCKVWCHMTRNNFIRSVQNFPDGTPCGNNKFCIKGQCQSLGCNARAVITDDAIDCPSATQRPVNPRFVSNAVREPIDIENRPLSRGTVGSWNEWAQWGSCTRSCGRGIRRRSRSCEGGLCLGAKLQSGGCNVQPCQAAAVVGTWNTWSVWTACDATCGGGRQMRKRGCKNNGNCRGLRYQYKTCNEHECFKQEWSQWRTWSTCTQTCGKGSTTRRRSCKSSICLGKSRETESCNPQECPSSGNSAKWTDWSDWSPCSRSCGGGTFFQRRRCEGDGVCFGTSVAFSSCNTQNCRLQREQNINRNQPDNLSDWSEWSTWGTCSTSCDNGVQRRTRVCLNGVRGPCGGVSSETRGCNSQLCGEEFSLWSEWGPWSECSCLSERQHRFRDCLIGVCVGQWTDERFCHPTTCRFRF